MLKLKHKFSTDSNNWEEQKRQKERSYVKKIMERSKLASECG